MLRFVNKDDAKVSISITISKKNKEIYLLWVVDTCVLYSKLL